MKLHYAFLGAALVLAACGGTSDIDIGGGGGGGDGDGGGGGGLDDDEIIISVEDDVCAGAFVCSGDLSNVTFDNNGTLNDASDDTLTITGLPFDDDPLGAVFTYSGTDTDNGVGIFINNDTSTFNQYLALVRETDGGELIVGVATIEGYQDFGYRGAWVQLNDVTNTIPTLGLVEYTGGYSGFMVLDGSGDQYVTTGNITLEVDFTDSFLKGFVTGRTIETFAGAPVAIPNADITGVPDLVLNDTQISGGTFSGTANSYNGAETYESGTYQGWFGGAGAPVVGGFIEATAPEFDDTGDANITSLDTGVFTAECAGSSTGCAP